MAMAMAMAMTMAMAMAMAMAMEMAMAMAMEMEMEMEMAMDMAMAMVMEMPWPGTINGSWSGTRAQRLPPLQPGSMGGSSSTTGGVWSRRIVRTEDVAVIVNVASADISPTQDRGSARGGGPWGGILWWNED